MSKPTLVLVHGAFTDASSWRPVVDLLDAHGHTVLAPPNPLRGLAGDAAYIQAVIASLDEPVVLVGHSYGAAVITVAGAADNVRGLVYVAGLVPTEGESISALQSRYPALSMDTLLRPQVVPDGIVEVSIDAERFHDVFCADLPDADASFLARAQRPLTATAFEDRAAAAAWRTKPSWAVFGTADRPVAPELHRFQYARAGASVTEVENAAHFVMLSRPDVVAGVIHEAAARCAEGSV